MHQYGPVLMCMRSKDFLKQNHTKQAGQLSRYKQPIFHDIAFSTKITVPPMKPTEPSHPQSNTQSGTPALPAPLVKTLSGRMTPDKSTEPSTGTPNVSPTTRVRRSLQGMSPRSPSDSRSPSMASLRKSMSGRLSRSGSEDASDDLRFVITVYCVFSGFIVHDVESEYALTFKLSLFAHFAD